MTRADSPPPNPGVVRDLPPSAVSGSEYIGPDVNIMHHSEKAMEKLRKGEPVILVPVPGRKWDPQASERRIREEFPQFIKMSKAAVRRLNRELGR